jgi:hypothetical protein
LGSKIETFNDLAGTTMLKVFNSIALVCTVCSALVACGGGTAESDFAAGTSETKFELLMEGSASGNAEISAEKMPTADS